MVVEEEEVEKEEGGEDGGGDGEGVDFCASLGARERKRKRKRKITTHLPADDEGAAVDGVAVVDERECPAKLRRVELEAVSVHNDEDRYWRAEKVDRTAAGANRYVDPVPSFPADNSEIPPEVLLPLDWIRAEEHGGYAFDDGRVDCKHHKYEHGLRRTEVRGER